MREFWEFAMAHKMKVRPHKGAVYLPGAPALPIGELGKGLSCVVCAITGFQVFTEETLVERARERIKILPRTLCQEEVNIKGDC